jgi:hypothetical protein
MDADLYAVPLGEFIARRDLLAKELVAAGDADEAKRVKALRKPTVTAWTLNQVAHGQPELVAALVEAHRAMRSAGSAADVRAASAARMTAIREIVDAADDASETIRKKMRSTLLAAGTDPDAETAVVEGRLERELEPSGLGGFGIGLDLAPTGDGESPSDEPAPAEVPARETAEETAPKAETAKTVKARERAERWRKEAEEAAEEARALRKAADRADRQAVVAEERAASKLQRAEDALRALDGD